MWILLRTTATVLVTATAAVAAPNVTNATQKGSLLIWADIRLDSGWNTLIRLQNDGSSDVDVICYWMDGNKNRVDFIVPLTRNQAAWFDARTGNGTYQVNRFPQSVSNGFDNPFLAGPWPGGFVDAATTNESNDSGGPYLKGMLACWAVDGGAQNQVKWNHLSGTATQYHAALGAYEYSAYTFFVPTGIDLEPIGAPGTLNLNGVEYDSCPLYQIGQFSPPLPPLPPGAVGVGEHRVAIVGCSLNLNQDWTPVYTKLQFDVWNEDEVKFTGAFECADSWHESQFQAALNAGNGGPVDAAAQNFAFATLGTYAGRFRVQGVKSTQCEAPLIVTQAVGIVAVHRIFVVPGQGEKATGTTLVGAGKFSGRIVWDPEGAVPEGGIR